MRVVVEKMWRPELSARPEEEEDAAPTNRLLFSRSVSITDRLSTSRARASRLDSSLGFLKIK